MSPLIRALLATAALVMLILPARAQSFLELSPPLVACADRKDVDNGEGVYQACLNNERNATPWLIQNWDRLSPSARDLCAKGGPGGAMFYAGCIAIVIKRETKDATVCRSLSAALGFDPCV